MLFLQTQQPKALKKSLLRNLIQQLQEKSNYERQESKTNVFRKCVNPQIKRQSIRLTKVWKGSGLVNKQFGEIKPLRNKVMNEWQIQRVSLSKRSYSSPKEFKGIKNDYQSREFKIKSSTSLHSKQFNRYLQTIKQKYQENLFRPNTIELQKLADKKKQLSITKLKFSTSNNFFGVPKQQQKFGTLTSFKSDILRKTDKFQ